MDAGSRRTMGCDSTVAATTAVSADPQLHRNGIYFEALHVKYEEFLNEWFGESSAGVRERVETAHNRQGQKFNESFNRRVNEYTT
jgi:predicted ATPase with chaperone activity